MNKKVSSIPTSNTFRIRPILLTILIMTIFWLVASFVKDIMIRGIKERDRTDVQKENITKKKSDNVNIMYEQVATILYYFIIFIGIFMVLPMYGVESSTTFAIVGTVGLALSLSTQNLLNNFWAGVIILFNDIYKIDDIIRFSSKQVDDCRGKVKEFNLFYTKISKIEDGKESGQEISLPNSLLYSETAGILVNESIVYDS